MHQGNNKTAIITTLSRGPRHPQIFSHFQSNILDATSLFQTNLFGSNIPRDWFEENSCGIKNITPKAAKITVNVVVC